MGACLPSQPLCSSMSTLPREKAESYGRVRTRPGSVAWDSQETSLNLGFLIFKMGVRDIHTLLIALGEY